jgi:hypothetical protein
MAKKIFDIPELTQSGEMDVQGGSAINNRYERYWHIKG